MLETAVQRSSQSSFFASSRFLPCMYPWQMLPKDDRRTHEKSNGEMIDMVRLVSGWCNRQNYCGGCYAWVVGLGREASG